MKNNRYLVLILLGVAGVFVSVRSACAQGWEIDWDAVSGVGSAIMGQIQQSPFAENLAVLTNTVAIDWEQVGRLVDQTLREASWDNAAVLRPYAERAVDHLKTIEGGEDAAAWLGERLDYLRVAEQYVVSESVPEPTHRVPSASSTGPKQTSRPEPSRPKPRLQHSVNIDKDMQEWLTRIPKEPSSTALRLAPSLKRIFEAEGVPPALIWLAEVESSFNPNAKSPVGAAGLYQFMPATATRFGLASSPKDQRFDPELSAGAASRYLRLLYGRFADWPLALAAYNAGEGRVSRTLKQKSARSFEEIANHLPVETRMYVPRVIAVIRHREGLDLRQLPAGVVR